MYARSCPVAPAAFDRARVMASRARIAAAESIGALMLGPRANAWPQAHIAHRGSRRSASPNERTASS